MAHPPIANLICHWKMNDDAASTVVVDNRGAHNATWTRNTSLDSVTGKINEALSPNALNKAYVADNNDFSFTDGSSDKPFSFAKWVYFDTWRNGDRLINKAAEYEIAVDNNYLFFITRDATGGGYYSCRAPVAYFPTGEWLHIVCTYDGGGIASGRKIYVNSVQRDNDIWSGTTYTCMRNTTDHFFIGGIAGGGLTSRLDGSMDDIRMYDIELSQSQIDTLYNSGSGTEDEEGGDEAAYNVLFFSCNF